jgi:2-oxoglutarate ferredoxin oxidoreductase subunit alpha
MNNGKHESCILNSQLSIFNLDRVSLKITGAQGQGIDSIGEVLGKGLKRAGYCVFGYREYMSLIKGGHSSYQLDVSDTLVRSTETKVDMLVCLNHHGLENNLGDVKEGGIVVHQTMDWKFSVEQKSLIAKHKLNIVQLPVEEMLRALKAKPIVGNTIHSAFVWALLGQELQGLKELLTEQFGHKKDLLALNMKCVDEGFASYKRSAVSGQHVALPASNSQWSKQMLLTGSKAMGLGAIHAGVRLYAGYPMTPSSPLLTFMADMQNETGMVIKQAEDEITAAQIVSGAMFAGTRALTATSGGGFDLMSETLSMNGIIENPSVFVLAQRPGPATGLPTWTSQGDLLMAVGTSHGEFARCVISVSDAEDSFDLMNTAFNIAEEFQAVVIVLTDKQIAEAIFTHPPFDQKKAKLSRGKLITDPKMLTALKSTDRYDPKAKDGISPRWLPGAKAETFCAQADEHSADGTVDETAANAALQMEKRMKKVDALKKKLPEPVLYVAISDKRQAISTEDNPKLDLLLVGWGSTKGPALDVIELMSQSSELKTQRIGYLHYTYLWPLQTERLLKLSKSAKCTVFIEGNFQGQLAMLLRQECGFTPTTKILKYDGRPFFTDELIAAVSGQLSAVRKGSTSKKGLSLTAYR